MAAKNDVTGDSIRTKNSNKKYAEGWERIFGKQRKSKRNKRTTKGETPSTNLSSDNVCGACKVKQ